MVHSAAEILRTCISGERGLLWYRCVLLPRRNVAVVGKPRSFPNGDLHGWECRQVQCPVCPHMKLYEQHKDSCVLDRASSLRLVQSSQQHEH